MTPPPVTRACGCEPGVKLCPTGANLRRRLNKMAALTFGPDEATDKGWKARREYKYALKAFRRHIGRSR